jgi:hypothetical protein
MVSETRYTAFGEIRYQLDGMPTGYQYRTSTLEGTGQFSQMSEVGLWL